LRSRNPVSIGFLAELIGKSASLESPETWFLEHLAPAVVDEAFLPGKVRSGRQVERLFPLVPELLKPTLLARLPVAVLLSAADIRSNGSIP